MASFSEELWAEAEPIWSAIQRHLFLAEAQAGSLPLETFRFYLCQDYHYLEAFARVVATALAKAPDGETLEQLARRVLTPIERPLHHGMFRLAGLEVAEVLAAPIAPTNLAYQNHMLATASRGGLGEIAAALLPCPWTYHRLGSILRPPGDGAPVVYREWIAAYQRGLLAESTAAWCGFVDHSAAGGGPDLHAAMRRAFLTSFRYEWMFWDMAYRREAWPI